MKILLLFLFIIGLSACKPSSPEQKAADAALKEYQEAKTDSSARKLVLAIDKLVETKGYNDSTSAKYLLQAARVFASHNQNYQASEFYKEYIIHYPSRPDQADRIAEVITITEKEQKPELNQILYKTFVNRFPDDKRKTDYEAKITNQEIAPDSICKYIGTNMFNDSTFRLNEERAQLYIDGCELAVMADPNMPEAPEFLHRAAETARTLRNIPKAIDLYDWIINQYPTHKRASTSLFLKAFTYDNDLKDYETAGKLYNEFLSKYPNDEFAESAKFLLDNLGKSEEELRKMLEEKSKENVQ